jgi:ribonuclease VapC
MAEGVLDASAIMAFVRGEPGADVVGGFLPGALASTVNLSEAMAKAVESAPDRADASWHNLMALGVEIIDFDTELARRAGELRASTRKAGLSFADRACLALAEREGLPAVTADKRWAGLDLGIDIRLVR